METHKKHRMKADIRRIWTYRDCIIRPVDCQYPRCSNTTPIDFGNGIYHNRYWCIKFPNGTWVHVEHKRDARRYIDAKIEEHQ